MDAQDILLEIIDILNGDTPIPFIVDERNVCEAIEDLIDKYNEVNLLLENVQDLIG